MKTIKRTLAVLLTLFMLIGAVPVGVMNSSAANNEEWLWPIPSTKAITNGRHYQASHKGIDIPGNNMDVVAAKSGKVYQIFTGCNNWSHEGGKTCQQLGKCKPNTNNYYAGMCNWGYGRGIIIQHSDGGFSEYAHMSSLSVKKGDSVVQGQVIGKTGAYGNAYGAHLHFTLATKKSIWDKYNNNPLDRYSSGVNYIYSLNNVKEVKVATSNTSDGIKVSLSCSTSGATIYYTTNGSNPTTSSTRYTGPFNLTSTKTVRAIAVKSGMTNSSVTSKAITVNKVAKPTFFATATPGGYDVKITSATSGATIYYTTDGTTPTTSSSKYAGGVAISDTSELKATAVKSGMASSDIAVQEFEPVPPSTPIVRLRSASDIGIGDSVQIEWNSVGNAQEYYVYVNGVEQPATRGTVAAIALSHVGTYSITVKARNAFGDSPDSNAVTTVVHNNVNVIFAFDDGTVIKEQSVKYGGNATPPSAPSKVGHTFTGWRGSYTNVTADVTIVAEFIPEQYRITFIDTDGNVLKSKNVNYGESFGDADVPTVTAPLGYKFVTWVVKSGKGDSYEFANGDVTFEPSFAWENPDVPLAVSLEKAQRKSDSTGYIVTAKITNGTANAVEAKLVSVIKTSYDKMLVTEITNVSIPAYASNTEQVVNIACKDVGKVAEVYLVANDKDNANRTGGAYSAVATKPVTKESSSTYTYWGDWSGWQTDWIGASDTREVETKTQYSYRDKQTTTSTSSSLSGWTQSGSSVSYGAWGSWSGWSLTSQASSDTKDVETRTVYYYYHYCDGKGNFAPSTGYTYGKYGPHTLYSTTKFTINRTSTTGLSIADGHTKCEKNCGSYYYGGTKTQYRYRTRTKTTTYTFWKWGDWTAYDDAVVYASDNRQVQTRTVYRYRDLLVGTNTTSTTDIGAELERTGTEYTVSGTLANVTDNYTGKVATVMVYKEKNVDPTEEQMEYMTQIIIGANNSYEFTFLPKEEISAMTGDYIVSFGVATADRLINNVEKIEAPKPVYDVTFKSFDGTIIETQQVTEGEDAVAPKLDAPEGYEIRWNRTLTNITKSVEITAVTKAKTYTVVFVDWANSEIVRIDTNVAYGSEINFPPARTAVGKVFTGWSLPQGSTVSNTMVIEAQYEDVLKTVTFLNKDGSVYLTTEIPYGSNAELPEEDPTAEGFEFLAWSNETSWWNVTEDVTIKPIFVFDQTAETPLVTYEPEVKVGPIAFELETETAEAEIHYTLDGSEPTEEDALFEDEAIFVEERTVVKAKAFKANMNPSPVAEVTIEVIPESSVPVVTAITNVSQYEVGKDYAKICMKLENPEGFVINSYGYTLYNEDTEDVRDYENSTVAGATDTILGKVFTVNNLEPGTYVYSFFADIENVGYIVSESETFTIDETVEPHVHTYDAGVITTQPTCTAVGVRTYTCTTCEAGTEGHSYSETIPALGHTEPDSHGNCQRCGTHLIDVCKWCGQVHEGFFQKIIGFFHNILAAILGAKY